MRIRFQIRGYTPGRLCQFPKGGPKPKFAFVFNCGGPQRACRRLRLRPPLPTPGSRATFRMSLPTTFKDYGMVAKGFERSRRRDLLSFAHHREVAWPAQ
jgi:hypothetical protein